MSISSGKSKHSKEHRRSNRYPVEADATIKSGSFSKIYKTLEISAGGFSVRGNLPAELKTEELDVVVVYTKSDKSKITAEGKCRLIDGTLNRVEFFEPANALQNLLDDIWG